MWTDISESAVIMDSEALVYLETWMCVGFGGMIYIQFNYTFTLQWFEYTSDEYVFHFWIKNKS